MKAKLHTVFVFSILISNIVLFSQVSAQEHLAASDGKLNQVYKQLMERLNGSQKQQLKLDQREWIKKRDAMVKSSPNNPQGALDFATQQRVLVLSQLLNGSGFHEQRTFTQAEASLDANGLYDQGYKYFLRGDYAKAEMMYGRALSIYERTLGPQHPNVAAPLTGLGNVYQETGEYSKALPLYERAVSIYEKTLGPQHPNVAAALNGLGNVHLSLGHYAKSVLYYSRALPIIEVALGKQHPDVAATITGLGSSYNRMGNYAQAGALYERALTIYEKVLGSQHPDVAMALNGLGCTYIAIGNYKKALSLHERALAIYEKVLGPQHPNTANSLNNLAYTYLLMGDYEKVLPLEEKALSIREKVFGPNNPKIAESLLSIAEIHSLMGNYERALPLHEKALSIQEKVFGPHHPDTANSLYNLAKTHLAIGNYNKAGRLQERALSIREKVFGSNNPKIADSLLSIAASHYSMGNYEKALPLQERALAIYEKVLGPKHPDTARSLNSLAYTYCSIGNYAKALPLQERALSIREQSFGSNHIQIADSLMSIASTHYSMGNYEKVLPLEEKALSISEKALGPEHPDTLQLMQNIALTQYLSGCELSAIRATLTKVYSGKESSLGNILTMDEETRHSWRQKNLNFPLINILSDEQRCQFILRTKGIVLDSIVEDQAALKILGLNSPQANEIAFARRQIGKLAFSTKRGDQDELVRLKSGIDVCLSSAARQRVKIGQVRESATITPNAVGTALPSGAVLIELIQFADPNIKGNAYRCYGALILERSGESKLIRIDDAAGIDASVRVLREAIAKGDEKSLADQQKVLFEKLWNPIAKNLPDGTRKLFIGADGQLNFLSFAALPAPDGRFLAEHFDIAYVGSGRDLARKVSPSESKTVALFADPVFDRQTSAFSTNALAIRSGEVEAFGQIVLPPLPGTRAEESIVEEIVKGAGWSPEAHLGEAANKSAIMALKSPGILHLATHGFYLNNLPSNGAEGVRGMKLMELGDSSKPALPPKIDPMHASGIALTGAQATLKAWSEGRVPDPNEDGILTAEEVGALNLDGTWLVTLSACETGVGASRSGEGVFGLRRAFMIAGAQNLLMTLWPVSDEVTPRIMADFYKEALKTGDAAGSLAKVQREWLVKLRDEKGLLAAVRDAGPFAMVVMAKQDSTFSYPSTVTPIASPQTTASPSSSSVPAPTPAPPEPAQPVPSSSPAPSLTPGPEASPSATPGTSPNQTPSPEASPSETPVLSELVEFKKAA